MLNTAARFRVQGILWVLGLASAVPALAGPITGYKWNSIGPQPDCCFFPGGETGRTTSIAVNPADPNDIWIGTAGGGVWHSTSGGGQWFPMSDDQASLAIGALALADCSSVTGCGRVYAGTGENAIRRDTYYGAGLLVGTIDSGGLHWTLRDGKPTYNFARGSIYNVVLDPTTSGSSQVLYVTLSSGVTASASESTVTAPEPSPGGYGIYKSTDNGITWTKLIVPGSSTIFGNGKPTDLEMDRTNSSVLYAGFLGRGIFKSADAGTTWCPLNPGIPKPLGCPLTTGLPNPNGETFDHVEIDVFRGDHNHLYATLGDCPDRLVNDCDPSVYESTNGGLNWTQRYFGSTDPTFFGDVGCPRGYSRYMHGLTISPSNAGTLYIAGFHLCESDDHGASWSAIDDTNTKGNASIGSQLHPDHHAIVFHDSNLSRVYDVNDGGVALSSDGGAHWTPSTYGLDAFEFQSLAASPATPNVFGGTQDNAGVMWTGSKQWEHLSCCGDGGFAMYETYNVGGFYDLTNMYITSNLGGLGNLAVLPIRSKDWGKHWPSPDLPPAYDVGLDTGQSRSFYPPLVNGGGYTLFGTDRLFTSVTQMDTFNLKSPALSTDPETEIFSGADAITAIAVAPSNQNRIYLGYYSGKVFVTSAPCSTIACWTQVASPLPGAPVTWIAIDPTNPDLAYATVSGFGAGVHAFTTTSAGASWAATGSLAELNGVPADVIAIDPSSPGTLFLGTDHGIYKSITSGGSWFRYSDGLPNVPVYSILFDTSHGRLFAATHGRGAYLLGPVFSKVYVDGPIKKLVLDQPAFGGGFRPNQGCGVKVLRQDGSVCASGSTDALGGAIGTDADGVLVSTKAGYFTGLPVVWTCAHGNCLGTDVKNCLQAGNPIAAIEVNCGGAISVTSTPGPPSTPNPPSSSLTLGAGPAGFPPSGGSFTLLPAIQTGDGSSQVLCSVSVPFTSTDSQGAVLQRAADAVGSSPACSGAGVTAVIDAPVLDGAVEDLFAHPGHLSLSAPDLTGGTLIASVRTAPGQATGVCFSAGRLDDPIRGRIRSMKVQFVTVPGGATGGTLTLIERSPLGECSIPVTLPAGSTPSAIASAVGAAFQAPGIPSPFPDCTTEANPRDVAAQGDAVLAALATELVVCIDDPGVGMTMIPTELCTTNADCDDGNPCTVDTCNAATGMCTSTQAPDGQACEDGNPCTVGSTCVNGACGVAVNCNDGNPCTTDSCNAATGGCVNSPVACDDGNPCTTDSCTAASGHCVFTPTVGAPCNTGDLCTNGGICSTTPGNPTPSCVGSPKCDDGNSCTADHCNPATGACSNPPILCDDGNPCTADSCQGGTCVSVAVSGACDDGNRCTIGDTCVLGPAGSVCQGTAVNCNDSNACTTDSCDPVTGGCVHASVATADVHQLLFTSHTSMNWSATSGAVHYNTYRGTIPAAGLGSRPPVGPVYDQTCFEHGDANGDGILVSTDVMTPPGGTGFYYLVSDVAGCGEGSIGNDSNGTPIPNASPCPSP
jgi:photosystem II stability/assembly factor-like uncharacterized protein